MLYDARDMVGSGHGVASHVDPIVSLTPGYIYKAYPYKKIHSPKKLLWKCGGSREEERGIPHTFLFGFFIVVTLTSIYWFWRRFFGPWVDFVSSRYHEALQCSSTASKVYIMNFDKTLKILKANFWLKLIIAILCNQRGVYGLNVGRWVDASGLVLGVVRWPGLA